MAFQMRKMNWGAGNYQFNPISKGFKTFKTPGSFRTWCGSGTRHLPLGPGPLQHHWLGVRGSGCSVCSYHRAAVRLCRGISQRQGGGHPHMQALEIPFSIFTATVVYPARPFRRKAVALTTFPNSPSPRVLPRTKFFRGNSHFGSSCIGAETQRSLAEQGEKCEGQS